MTHFVFKLEVQPRDGSDIRSVRGQQWGAATLVTAVVLLTAVTGLTLYSAAVSTTQLKISRNDAHAKMSFEYAQAGITEGVAWLNAQQEWIASMDIHSGWLGTGLWKPCRSDMIDVPCGNGQENVYDQNTLAYAMRNGGQNLWSKRNDKEYQVHFLTSNTLADQPTDPIVQIIAASTVAEQQEPTIIRQSVKRYNILANPPPAVFMVDGDLAIDAPVKFFSGTPFDAKALRWHDWIRGNVHANNAIQLCSASNNTSATDSSPVCIPWKEPASHSAQSPIPPTASTGVLAEAHYPADLFSFLFHIPREHTPLLEGEANRIQQCQALAESTTTGGFYWYDSDQPCTLPSMGSQRRPVLLVARSRTFVFAADAQIYGVIVLLPSPGQLVVNIESSTDVQLTGSLVSLTSLQLRSPGEFSMYYNESLLHTLRRQLGGFAKIPGTWNDSYEGTTQALVKP